MSNNQTIDSLRRVIDRVTAERDAALARVSRHEQCMAHVLERESATLQRLTEADERVDVLKGLLRDSLLYLPSHGMGSVTFELNKQIIAALKTAEGCGDEA